MRKPDFIIIGAARSGTTSLFRYLERHPDIFMSAVKEINFFSNEKYWRNGFAWYCRHFDATEEKIAGEASTSYTSYPHAAETASRIHHFLPEIKLIYVVRDPVDRLVSHYLHRVTRGVETRELVDIVRNQPDDTLLTQGKYCLQIEQYLNHFEPGKLHCLTIDELRDNPVSAVDRIFAFLGADAGRAGNQDHAAHNVNRKVTRKNRFGQSVLEFYHANVEQRTLPYRIKKIFLDLAEIGAEEIAKPALASQDLELLREYYREDLERFESLSGLDLAVWQTRR